MDFTEEHRLIFEEIHELAVRKNNDYGSSFANLGVKGLIPRIQDKYARLENLIWNAQEAEVTDEKAEDTAKDLANYAILLIMVLRAGKRRKEFSKNITVSDDGVLKW